MACTRAPKELKPPCDGSGVAGAGAPEELEPDGRLLQENKTKVKIRRGFQQQGNKKRTHRRVTRAASSSSSSSLSTKATIAPAKKRTKVLGQRKKQTTRAKGQSALICSPKSMLATTRVPRRVLDRRDFLAADGAKEELSARPRFPKVRGARGTRRGTYSSYT